MNLGPGKILILVIPLILLGKIRIRKTNGLERIKGMVVKID